MCVQEGWRAEPRRWPGRFTPLPAVINRLLVRYGAEGDTR